MENFFFPDRMIAERAGGLLRGRRGFALVHPGSYPDGRSCAKGDGMVFDSWENRRRYRVPIVQDGPFRWRRYLKPRRPDVAEVTLGIVRGRKRRGAADRCGRGGPKTFGAGFGWSLCVAPSGAESLGETLESPGVRTDVRFGGRSERNGISVSATGSALWRLRSQGAERDLRYVGCIRQWTDGISDFFFGSTEGMFSTPARSGRTPRAPVAESVCRCRRADRIPVGRNAAVGMFAAGRPARGVRAVAKRQGLQGDSAISRRRKRGNPIYLRNFVPIKKQSMVKKKKKSSREDMRRKDATALIVELFRSLPDKRYSVKNLIASTGAVTRDEKEQIGRAHV